METTGSVSELGILNPRVGATRFHIARHPPSEDLAFFVERHWIVRWDLRGREPYPQETLPHPCVNLVLEKDRSAVHGVGTRKFSVLLEGEGQVVGTKFKPGAFYPFVRYPVSELTDRSLSLRQAFGGDDCDALGPAVLARRDDREQIALVEDFLRPRLPERDENVATVVRIVKLALECRAINRVSDLAARIDLSARTLERLFRRYVGVSPKWVIRRFRLHEAADRVAGGAAVDWAALAHDLGYCDQAHFSRDFKAQVGRSPAAYAAMCAPRPVSILQPETRP
jgi:AraC-like DNA-binding protein